MTRLTLFRYILDDALYGIGYWAEGQLRRIERDPASGDAVALVFDAAKVERAAGTPVVDRFVSLDAGLARVDAVALSAALRAIHEGTVTYGNQPIGTHLKAMARRILFDDPEDVDYDAGDADVLVQAALFGDIVYG
jgi:hypothetical protein